MILFFFKKWPDISGYFIFNLSFILFFFSFLWFPSFFFFFFCFKKCPNISNYSILNIYFPLFWYKRLFNILFSWFAQFLSSIIDSLFRCVSLKKTSNFLFETTTLFLKLYWLQCWVKMGGFVGGGWGGCCGGWGCDQHQHAKISLG